MNKPERSPVLEIDLNGRKTVVIVVDEHASHTSIRAAAKLAIDQRNKLHKPRHDLDLRLRAALKEILAQRRESEEWTDGETARFINEMVRCYRQFAPDDPGSEAAYQRLSQQWLRAFEVTDKNIDQWWSEGYQNKLDDPVSAEKVKQALSRWRAKPRPATDKLLVLPLRPRFKPVRS
jgi:hypothetical protein